MVDQVRSVPLDWAEATRAAVPRVFTFDIRAAAAAATLPDERCMACGGLHAPYPFGTIDAISAGEPASVLCHCACCEAWATSLARVDRSAAAEANEESER